MKVYEIGELDRKGRVIQLLPREQRALARVEDRVGVEWRADGSARVYSRGYVGSVALSNETLVRIPTKVPIDNVLRLATLAYRTAPIPPALGNTLLDSEEPVLDWLAVMVVAEIETLLRHGLRQDFVLVEDVLPYVRGRLQVGTEPPWAHPGMLRCEFSDFLPDTPENRVIRATLEALGTQRLLPGLHPRMATLLRSFQDVELSRPSARLLDECRITRLNLHYQPTLALCRLFLEQSGLTAERGEISAPAFFFPLEWVFQEAVSTFLIERLPKVSRQASRSYQPVAGQPIRALSFAPDILIGDPPRLVADTKYAPPEIPNRFGGRSYRNDDVYQVVFYAVSFRCPALLIYPRVDQDIDVTFEIEGVPITILTVNMLQPALSGLDALVQRVKEFAALSEAA